MCDNFKRCNLNPIISLSDVVPSRPDFKVVGVFNAAVARFKDEVILLLRVAEQPKDQENVAPVLSLKNKKVDLINISPNDYLLSDSRVFKPKKGDAEFTYLTSISHIRCARSKDGIHFIVDKIPFIFPHNQYETFGIEDPRCTKIENTYYINFSSVSQNGIVEELVTTQDFKSYKERGIICLPDNKDVAIFPKKIDGKYWAFFRPTVASTGKHAVWISSSPNLSDWGNYHLLFSGSTTGWDDDRVGAGIPPIKTKKGWLEIYHGANKKNQYCLGALLLDKNDPRKILARSKKPIMFPTYPYEKAGFFGDVVFACGGLLENNNLTIYYGASDSVTCMASISLNDIFKNLKGS